MQHDENDWEEVGVVLGPEDERGRVIAKITTLDGPKYRGYSIQLGLRRNTNDFKPTKYIPLTRAKEYVAVLQAAIQKIDEERKTSKD